MSNDVVIVADLSLTGRIASCEVVVMTALQARAATARARLVADVGRGGGGGVGNGGVTAVNFRCARADVDERPAHRQSAEQHGS